MQYLSLFSGIEAASVAWQPLGWEPVAFAEIDPFCCAVLQHHYPDVPNLGDVEKADYGTTGPVDLLVFGSPCQSFSVAGLRGGLDDPRGNLAFVALGVVKELRPRWFLFENVPGLLNSAGGRDFAAFLAAVGECGYFCAWRILDAQYFGVPQRRRRVFVIGYLGDWRPPTAVLFERHSLQGHPPPCRETGEGVAGSLSARTTAGGGLGTDFECQGGVQVVNCNSTPEISYDLAMPLRNNDGSGNRQVLDFHQQASHHQSMNPSEIVPTLDKSKEVAVAFVPGQGAKARSLSVMEDQAPTLESSGSGNNRVPAVYSTSGQGYWREGTSLRAREQESHEQLVTTFQSSQSGIREKTMHATLDANNGSRRQNGIIDQRERGVMIVRRLTPRECERLQGFEDDYTLVPYRGKPAKDGPRYRSIGNSMAVPVVQWIGKRIQQVDMLRRKNP